MPTTGFNLVGNTYAGQAAGQFLLAAITEADLVNSGSVYIKETLSNKYTIPTWANTFDQFIQDDSAIPVDSGVITIGEQHLNLGAYQIYQPFNPQDFADQWFAPHMPELLIDRGLPVEANSVVLLEIMRQHAKFLNKLMMNGDQTLATNMKYIDGFITKAVADTGVVKVPSPVPLTNSNIVSVALDPLYALLPDALKFDPLVKFFGSYSTYSLYEEYQRAQVAKGIDITQMGKDEYRGHKFVKVADMPDNCIFVAKGTATMDSNMWLGLNSASDENNLKIAPLQANSDLWFVRGKMKVDVNYVFAPQVLLYKY
jgi:hypothetical protein